MAARVAEARIGQTCCISCNKDGFSPAQWVLGEDVQLLASCADLQNVPVAVGQVVKGSSFWNQLRLQESCEVAFHQAVNSSALRRALLSRALLAPSSGDIGYTVGDSEVGNGTKMSLRL